MMHNQFFRRQWLCLLLLLTGARPVAGDLPGSIDTAFNPQVNGPVNCLALAPDGQMVIAGGFRSVGATPHNGLARLRTDGAVDDAFVSQIDGTNVVEIGVLSDHRVIARTGSGPFTSAPYRLNALSPNGELEATLAVDQLRTAAGYRDSEGNLEIRLVLLRDGTPLLRLTGDYVESKPKVADFVLRLENKVLTSQTTNWVADPYAPRQSTGQIISLERESVVDSGRAVGFALLRRDDSGHFDGSFRTLLGALFSVRLAVQTDDRVLALLQPAGVTAYDASTNSTLRRFKADGTPDPTFPALEFVGPVGRFLDYPFQESVSSVVVASDASVLVSGIFTAVGGLARSNLVRVHLGPPQSPAPPGLIDQPESADALLGQTTVFRVNPRPGGRLAVQWFFQNRPLVDQTNLGVVLSNVSTSAEGDYTVEVRNSAGTVRSTSARLTVVPAPGGSVDPSFDPGSGAEDGEVTVLLLQPDGRVLVGGTFTRFNGLPRPGLVRLNRDGSTDATFTAGLLNPNSERPAKLTVAALARHPDGPILFGGVLQQAGKTPATNVFRLNPDGTLDSSFAASPAHPPTIYSLAVLGDNRVLVGGTFNYTNAQGIVFGDSFRNLVRLSPEGTLDPTFKPSVSASQYSFFAGVSAGGVRAMAPLADGKLLVAGSFEPQGVQSSFALLNFDGSRNDAFEPRIYSFINAVSGRGGVAFVSALARDGTGDAAIAGDFQVAGRNSAVPAVARFTESGRLTGMPHTVQGTIQALAFQTDGKLVVGGWWTNTTTLFRTNLARLHRDGSVDLSFGGAGGGPDGRVAAIVVEPSGAILIGGAFTTVDGALRCGVARLYGSGKVYRQLLQPRAQDSEFSASIQTLTGKRYALERSDSISSPAWTTVATLNGDGNLKVIRDPARSSNQRFYRVHME